MSDKWTIPAQPGYRVVGRDETANSVKDVVIAWRISEGVNGLAVQPITVCGLVADPEARVMYLDENGAQIVRGNPLRIEEGE